VPPCGVRLAARAAVVVPCVLLVGAAVGVERGTSSGARAGVRPAPAAGCTALRQARTERVDVSSEGAQPDAPILRAALSANGRFVAFSSAADNLVRDDTNRVADVFVRDLRTQRTVRVSVASDGAQGNGASFFPSISADGRYVAFRSYARNFADYDLNGVEDAFVHDRLTGLTERVSIGDAGQEANGPAISSSISADGSAVAFSSPATNLVPGDRNEATDVFVRDLVRARTIRVSVGRGGEANGASEGSSISADGHVVGFRSFASDLVRDDTNGLADDFVRDWATGVTERVNVSSSGKQANEASFRVSLSADGRFVAFRSRASNLVPHDTNRALDVFEHDRVTGRTTRISVASDGAQAASGGFAWSTLTTYFMSRAFLSANGRYAVFGSRAENLVPGDTNDEPDVFVHDLVTGQTVRVSVTGGGKEPDGGSYVAGISADGRVVAFLSSATNLVHGDTDGRRDVFVRVRGRRTGPSSRACAGHG